MMKKLIMGIVAALMAIMFVSCMEKDSDVADAGTAKSTTIQYTPNERALLKLNNDLVTSLEKERATVDSLQKVIDDLKSKYETEEEGE